MPEAPFTEDELRRFGKFLELLGLRMQGDNEFRKLLAGTHEDIEVSVAETDPDDVSVEFHDTTQEVLATVVLPPGTRKEDVKLHVTRDDIELVLKERRLVILALPEPVKDERVQATFRNNVLDVVMQKERKGTEGQLPG